MGFPVILPVLWVNHSVGVDSISCPNSFSLVSSPPTLGWPPICGQSAICCKGETGNSLGRDTDTVAAGSYCSSKQKSNARVGGTLTGLFP